MSNRSKMLILFTVFMAVSIALIGCTPQATGTPVVERVVETVVVTEVVEVAGEQVVVTQVVEVEVERPTATPEPVDRAAAWLDTIVVVEEPSDDAAITRLQVGDLDLYSYTISDAELFAKVQADPTLTYNNAYGTYNEITFNVATFADETKLNPFTNPKIREAMNWLIDRNYVVQEIYGGLGVARWVPINAASADAARLAPEIAAIRTRYGYNLERATQVVTEEMEAMGATMTDGKWTFNGEPVVLIALIRTEDERLEIGDYLSNQLESIGFTLDRQYKTSGEAAPCWQGDVTDGCFSFYTGGWISTAISRDAGTNFSFFYTPAGLGLPLWAAYTPTEEFDKVAQDLNNNAFTSMEQRSEMFAQALDLAMLDSSRIWVNDRVSFTPRRAEVAVASDLSASVYGTRLWSTTLRRIGEVGGSMTVGMPSILTQPWNPVGGSNWVYDTSLYNSTAQAAFYADPYTGLQIPVRAERAEVTVQTGLPVAASSDWLTLDFADEIVVPDDAWVRWDATEQRFLTASEYYTETVTALQRGIVYYEDDLFTTNFWHDGSPLAISDFVSVMISTFDLGDPASANYDAGTAPALELFLSAFKGVRILSTDPLVIETYTDAYGLDAENGLTSWWPNYGFGEAPWHTIALGLLADANGEAVFSNNKSTELSVDQLNYISGPTLDILSAQLNGTEETPGAAADGYIPYAPTMSQYVTAEEAATRYANLQEFFRRRGHYWLGTGAFYLQRAFPVEGTVILERNENFPDQADRWSGFSAPPIPEVLLDGSDRVTIGTEATYEVFVDFQGEAYPADDVASVAYMLFDASGEIVATGDATAVEDGLYEITLSAEVTGLLTAGSNELQVVVVSKRVALPASDSIQFVSAAP